MPRTKPYHHGNLKETLLGAAIQLIAETGPAGFNLREVARRAGVSHNAPYRHFRDKDELLADVAAEGFQELTAALNEGDDPGLSPVARLKRAGYSYVSFALRRPEHFAAMFDPAGRQSTGTTLAFLNSVIDDCQREAQLPQGGTEYRALLAWSLMHGIAKLAVSKSLPFRLQDEVLQFSVSAIDASIASLQHPLDSATRARPERSRDAQSGCPLLSAVNAADSKS